MLARLTIYQPDKPVRQYLLDKSRHYLVGRDPSCVIRIDDASLSRRHARFARTDDGWQLTDLASKNGTCVGGEPVDACALDGTQWIEFGTVIACFDQVSNDEVAGERRRVAETWQTSIEVSREMRPSDPPETVLRCALQSLLAVTGARRGYVVQANDARGFEPACSEPADAGEFSGSRSVVARVLAGNVPVVASDVGHDPHLVSQPSIAGGGIKALACLPLRVGSHVLGAIYVDSDEPGKQFTHLDVEIFEALADHAALVLSVARVRDSLGELGALLPAQLDRDRPPSKALLDRLQELLPAAKATPGDPALAGADR